VKDARFVLSDSTRALIATAYSHLGITADAVACAPQITPQLRMIANTLRREGQPKRTRKVIDVNTQAGIATVEDTTHKSPYGPGTDLVLSWPAYLASSDHADARKVLQVYYSIPRNLRMNRSNHPIIPLEAYCVAANVSPLSILAILTGEIVRLGAQASTIIAAINHPRVVQKSVEMALTDEGIEDRNLLSKATGFLPTPKGSQTLVQVNTNATANAAAAPVTIAPPPEQTIRRLVDRFNDARELPAAPMPDLTSHDDAITILTDSPDDEDDDVL
jgi:hypothetical protein